MDSPKISIITPCYNERASIADFIQAVFSQDYGNFELIIVDGGSTDGTIDIIKKYLPEHPGKISLLMESGEVRSPANARNLGLSKASGELVLFKDADSIPRSPAMLSVVAETYLKNNKPDAVRIVILIEESRDSPLVKPIFEVLYGKPLVDHFISKALLESLGGYDITLGVGEDYDLDQRWMKAAKSVVAAQYTATYAQGEFTLRRWLRRELWYGRAWRRLCEKYPEKKREAYSDLKAVSYILGWIPILTIGPQFQWFPGLLAVWVIPLLRKIVGDYKKLRSKRLLPLLTILSYIRSFTFSAGFISSYFSGKKLGR